MKIKNLAYLSIIILALIFLSLFILEKKEPQPVVTAPDLFNHRIYSNYRFSDSEKVINIGTQPIYMPTGLISEVMKRDLILNKAIQDLGLRINYFPFLKGDDVNFFLSRNKLDAGIGGDMPTLTVSATKDMIIPVMIQRGFISILANRPLFVRQLRGKRIAYANGSNAHYVLLNALASAGLKTSDVTLIPLDVTEMSAALFEKEIDAFSAWEPTPTIALKEHPEFVTVRRQISTGYMYFLKSFSKKNPRAVRHIVAAVVRSLLWMRSDKKNLLLASNWSKETGEKLLGRKIDLSEEEIAALAMKDIIGMLSLPFVDEDILEINGPLRREFKFLKKLAKIPVSSSWEKVFNSFDRKILYQIMAESNRYQLKIFNYKYEL